MLPVSLRGRLLAAFTAVILLTLVVVGFGVVWVIQAYRTQLSVDHFSELASMASSAGRQLERQDGKPEEIASFVSNVVGRPDVRVLVLDTQGKVLASSGATGTDQTFTGRVIDVPPVSDERATARGRTLLGQRTRVWTFGGFGPGRRFVLVTPVTPNLQPDAARPDGLDRFFARQASYRIVLAVPEQSFGSAFRELFPQLAIAALIAIAASAAAAWWLARSIAQPLRRITTAAEQMARGALRQSIPEDGSQEVAQLAVAFNTMSREVERSHQALKEFLANASHELRTPLTSVQGFSQALVDGALAGEGAAEEAGKIINEEANRMRVLVEDLLYLSRVEADAVPAEQRPIDLDDLLHEQTRRQHFFAEPRGITTTLEVASTPPVRGDPDEIDRLFGNLLENAVKYTPNGGRISVRASLEGQDVVVAVHNTGSYIPAEDQARVFERFYRLDKSRARRVEGSGLGLAIAREIAQRHGGTISVASDPQAGTTFIVRLPRADGASAYQPVAAERTPASASGASGGSGRAAQPARFPV